MAIRFSCDCGQTITARSEYVGRKVQCVGCKKILLVPGDKKPAPAGSAKPAAPPLSPPRPAETPRPDLPRTMVPEPMETVDFNLPNYGMPQREEPIMEAEPTEDLLSAEPGVEEAMLAEPADLERESEREPAFAPAVRTLTPSAAPGSFVRFRCACGADFQAARVHAGEPTRCTQCGDVLFIPARTDGSSVSTAPVKASFDQEKRYRPGKDPSASSKGVFLVLLWLLLAGGGVFAYWQFYAKDALEREAAERRAFVPVRSTPPGSGAVIMGAAPPGGRPPAGAMGMGGGRPPAGARGMAGGRPGGGAMGMGGVPRPPGLPPPPGAMGMRGGRPGLDPAGGAMGMQGGAPQAGPVRIIKDGEDAKLKALDLVPATALMFSSLRVSDVLAEPEVKAVLDNPLLADPLKQVQLAEAAIGMKLEDVERVVFIAADARPDAMLGLVQTKKPFDREKLLTLARVQPATMVGEGARKRGYYRSSMKEGPAFHFVNDTLLVVGQAEAVEAYLKAEQPAKEGPLAVGLKMAAGPRHVVMAGHLPDALRKMALGSDLPPQLAQYKDLLEIKSAVCAFDGRTDSEMNLEIEYIDAAKAQAAKGTLDGLLKQGREAIKGLGIPAEALKPLEAALDTIKIEQKGTRVTITGKGAHVVVMTGLLLPAVQKVREAANRATTQTNFKQLGIGVHNYASAYRDELPPVIHTSKDGKPLFSWRVTLLPYVEQDQLYRQLKLDEPWNSEHNKKILDKTPMPKIFEVVGAQAPANMTYIQMFSGKGTMFEQPGKVKYKIGNIPDGTSNTLLFVVAAKPVHWAEPTGDIAYSPQVSPVTQLRKGGAGTIAGMFDGSVRMLSPNIAEKTLRWLIEPDDGNVIPNDE